MVDYDWFQFKDTGYNLTHLPFNTHLIRETTSKIYYISADNQKELWIYTIATGADDIKTTRDHKIQALWDDGTKIWFVDCDNDGTADDFDVWYITIATDVITSVGTSAGQTANTVYAYDIHALSGEMYVLCRQNIAECGLWHVTVAPIHEQDTELLLGPIVDMLPSISVGTTTYFVLEDNTNFCGVFTHNGLNIVNVDYSIEDYSAPAKSQQFLAYDNDDRIYYILNKDSDSLDYLVYYSIAATTVTDTGIRADLCVMCDRNCANTSGTPWEFEKGFHISSPYVYQFTRSKDYLVKIQQLATGTVISAITDKYLIDSNKNVYEYTNYFTDYIKRGSRTHACNNIADLRISSSLLLSTDQLIEIWKLKGSIYTLLFRGKAGIASYDDSSGLYFYNPKNFGWDDLEEEVTYTCSATDIGTAVVAIIAANCDYIYTDVTATPTTTTTATVVFSKQKLWDVLFTLAILANGYWWVEPDGHLYFRKYSNMPITEYYYMAPDNFNDEPIGESGTSIAWVDSATLPNSCTCTIIEELDNHKNVLKLTHDGAGSTPEIVHNFTAATLITYEWYWASSDITRDAQYIRFRSSSTNAIALKINNSKYYYLNLAGALVEIVGDTPTNDIFDHFKIIADCATDTFDLYINGTLRVDDGQFRNAVASLDSIKISLETNVTHSQYIDAISDVADANYETGDNAYDRIANHTSSIGVPITPKKRLNYYNTWNIQGGWNVATNSPFTPTTPTDAAHILLYGKHVWDGRSLFPECRTQASLDALVTALKAWQGMQTAPDDVELYLLKDWYQELVGRKVNFSHSTFTQFITAQNMLIKKNVLDFKTYKNRVTLSTNIVEARG